MIIKQKDTWLKTRFHQAPDRHGAQERLERLRQQKVGRGQRSQQGGQWNPDAGELGQRRPPAERDYDYNPDGERSPL